MIRPLPTAYYVSIPESTYDKRGVVDADQESNNSYIEQRPRHIIDLHAFLAIFEDIKCIFQMIFEEIANLFKKIENKNVYNKNNYGEDKFETSGKHQVFFIPGLGDPGIWGQLSKKALQKENPDINVCVCQNKNNGNQDINQTFHNLYETVSAYCKANPERPIVLSGVSLGGRMAHEIELQLRKDHPKTPVLLYTMAPAFASKFCSFMDKHVPDLTRKVLNTTLVEAFKVGSPSTYGLIEAINKTIPENVAERIIIAVRASNDGLIDKANGFAIIENQAHKLHYTRRDALGCSHLGVLSCARKDMHSTISGYFNPSSRWT